MIDAREKILAQIRRGLGREDENPVDTDRLQARIAQHPRHIEPAFTEPLDQRFCQKIEAAASTVVRVETIGAVGAEVERFLGQSNLPPKVLISGDALLQAVEWPIGLECAVGVPDGDDLVGITSALFGIAETGTLMLASGSKRPTSLNFLPDYHIVVLGRKQIVARMEDAWDELRAQFITMPRSVNFISGPSKTADVEQTVEYGAHGPRCLHVVLVDQA